MWSIRSSLGSEEMGFPDGAPFGDVLACVLAFPLTRGLSLNRKAKEGVRKPIILLLTTHFYDHLFHIF